MQYNVQYNYDYTKIVIIVNYKMSRIIDNFNKLLTKLNKYDRVITSTHPIIEIIKFLDSIPELDDHSFETLMNLFVDTLIRIHYDYSKAKRCFLFSMKTFRNSTRQKIIYKSMKQLSRI